MRALQQVSTSAFQLLLARALAEMLTSRPQGGVLTC